MSAQTRKYLVTGGTGFIGRGLVKALVRQGKQVRVLDDDSRGRLASLEEVRSRIEIVRGDIRDPRVVSEAARGVDSVLHLAFVNGTEFFYEKPELVLEVGVKGMMNVLDACIERGVPELMLMSSSEVYQHPPAIPTDETAPYHIPDPLNPRYSYAGGKLISELLAINYGRRRISRVVVVRPHNVYGPDMGWEHVIPQFALRMKSLAAEGRGQGKVRFPIQGTGDETRSFVHIDDFVDGTLRVLEQGEHLGIYHVGTMDERSIRDVAIQVGRCFGIEIEVVPGAPAAGGTPRRCPDIRKAMGLGYEPRVRFEDGLRETVSWYQTHERG